MLKLQLLDPRFFEGGRIRKATAAAVILTIGVLVLCVWFTSKKKMWAEDMKTQATMASTNKANVDTKQGEIDQINAEVAPFDAQLVYIKSLRDYSDNWPQHLRMLSRYIYNRAEVLSVAMTPTDFALQVRTKTTADVARLLMNLKQAYKAGLIAENSLAITGLTGWPNPTSPRGWGRDTRRRIEVPFNTGDLQAVNSGSRASSTLTGLTGAVGGGQGAGGPGGPGGSSGGPMPSAPGGPGGPGGPGRPGNESSGAPGSSGGGPGGPGGAGGPAGIAGGLRSLAGIPLIEQQFFTNPLDAARQQFVLPSADPPPQPYLNLGVIGRWATPFGMPGGGAAAPGGAGGMPGGMPGMPAPGGPGGPGGPPPGMSGSGGPAGAPTMAPK